MKKLHVSMLILLVLPTYQVNARCHFGIAGLNDQGRVIFNSDTIDIKFVVNNASDKWMYLWMGHPNHGEDNGNLSLKPHSSATALGCSNGAGYAVTGIILTQGKDVLYTFDVDKPHNDTGLVTMHTWKGGCYVAYAGDFRVPRVGHLKSIQWDMSKMASKEWWDRDSIAARVRIDCV